MSMSCLFHIARRIPNFFTKTLLWCAGFVAGSAFSGVVLTIYIGWGNRWDSDYALQALAGLTLVAGIYFLLPAIVAAAVMAWRRSLSLQHAAAAAAAIGLVIAIVEVNGSMTRHAPENAILAIGAFLGLMILSGALSGSLFWFFAIRCAKWFRTEQGGRA